MDNKDRNNFRNKNNNRNREVANVEFADELIDLDEIDRENDERRNDKDRNRRR